MSASFKLENPIISEEVKSMRSAEFTAIRLMFTFTLLSYEPQYPRVGLSVIE